MRATLGIVGHDGQFSGRSVREAVTRSSGQPQIGRVRIFSGSRLADFIKLLGSKHPLCSNCLAATWSAFLMTIAARKKSIGKQESRKSQADVWGQQAGRANDPRCGSVRCEGPVCEGLGSAARGESGRCSDGVEGGSKRRRRAVEFGGAGLLKVSKVTEVVLRQGSQRWDPLGQPILLRRLAS